VIRAEKHAKNLRLAPKTPAYYRPTSALALRGLVLRRPFAECADPGGSTPFSEKIMRLRSNYRQFS